MPLGVHSASLVCQIDGLQLGESTPNAAQGPEADSKLSTDSSLAAFFECFQAQLHLHRVLLLETLNPLGYAKFRWRSHDAVIRIYDSAGNVIEMHEHAGDFKEP